MYFLKNFNRRILNFLSVSLFVLTLVISPSLLDRQLQLFAVTPGLEFSAQAQAAAQSKSPLSGSQFDIAQAPATSEDTAESRSAKKEAILDFFAMAMGALAGLVLFIYGVTRLSEGLEELGTDRMKSFLGKCTTNRFAAILTGTVATTLLESSNSCRF